MNFDSSAYSILVVDNDDNIQSLLKLNLQTEGYRVEVRNSAEEALTDNLESYRLVITEVSLPGEIDGWEFVDRMKESRLTANIPVMFCTTHDSENDIIRGLNAGADDYIVKPFSLREMMARVRSVLRRHRNMAPQSTLHTIEYRTLILNVDAHTLLIDGESVSLSPTEFSILQQRMVRRRDDQPENGGCQHLPSAQKTAELRQQYSQPLRAWLRIHG